MISQQVLHSIEEMQSLTPEWSALWRACPSATPFQSPEWLMPWTRHLFKGGQILMLTIRDGEDLIGLAPLFCWGTAERTISFLGAGISDYGDLLFAPGREGDCVSAVQQFLVDEQANWDVLDLQELRSGSGLLSLQSAKEECSVCPVLDLQTYPDSMDSKHKVDVRRAGNKLRKQGDLDFVAAASLDEFFHLYQLRWGTMDSDLRLFYTDSASALAGSGLLRLCSIRIAGKAAAAIFAFTAHKTLYCYLSAFDSAMSKQSPGAVLLGWLIDQAISEGMKEVDFLRDNEAYKYLWGARDRISYKLHTRNARALGSAG